MTSHDHNPILGLYGTPRAAIRSRVSARAKAMPPSAEQDDPAKDRQFDRQLDLPQGSQADKPVVSTPVEDIPAVFLPRCPPATPFTPGRGLFVSRGHFLIWIKELMRRGWDKSGRTPDSSHEPLHRPRSK